MRGLTRKAALFAATATLAFSGVAATGMADNSGHHEHWTQKQCANQLSRWQKAHKNPTAKQKKQENSLLKKHDCNERV